MNGRRLKTAAALTLTILALAGCGGEDESSSPPTGPLAEALAAIGGGGANGSLGVGWAEPRLVERSGAGPRLIAAALGPNAGSVVEAAPRLRRSFGFDPLSAERLISLGGSYAFGMRLDGVDGRRLGRALVAAGGRSRRAARFELLEIGDYAVVPEPLLEAGVLGLGAFDALGRELIVMAISDRARASLLGRGDPLLDEPLYAAAADCLGDVVAARLIPDKLLLSTDLGVDLVAVGVRDGGEVLCVIGGTPERAEEVRTALETSLAPEARDPGSGEPLDRALDAVEVTGEAYAGVEAVRAEVTLDPDEPRGFLFGTLARASVVGLINGSRRTFER